MIRIQNVTALIIKQLKDTLKNPPILMLFFVFPCISLVMGQAMKAEAGVQEIFLSIFATMHCVFTPIATSATMIAEEKETNTLRVLILSNVSLREYILSLGSFILAADLITACAFLIQTGGGAADILQFLLSSALGCLISIVVGVCAGLYAKNAGAATGLAVPLGMVFSFLPMMAHFNSGLMTFSQFIFGQQVSFLLSGKAITFQGAIVLLVNIAVFAVLSTFLYRKTLKEE